LETSSRAWQTIQQIVELITVFGKMKQERLAKFSCPLSDANFFQILVDV
jgi:hypothetical protein